MRLQITGLVLSRPLVFSDQHRCVVNGVYSMLVFGNGLPIVFDVIVNDVLLLRQLGQLVLVYEKRTWLPVVDQCLLIIDFETSQLTQMLVLFIGLSFIFVNCFISLTLESFEFWSHSKSGCMRFLRFLLDSFQIAILGFKGIGLIIPHILFEGHTGVFILFGAITIFRRTSHMPRIDNGVGNRN